MFDRAKIIDDKFKSFLKNKSSFNPVDGDFGHLTAEKAVELFETQITSRLLDIKARKLRAKGKSFYTIGSSGHEGMAVVGDVSRLTDMAFLHYRDAALMIQRSKKLPGSTIIHDMLLSFCACSEDPISGGRHKVLGSKELFIPPQTSTIASHLPKAVGAAFSLMKAKKLGIESEMPLDSVVICTFGDASLNHASSQTALNCASWMSYQNIPLPLVFICEDNGIGISVPTPFDWVKNSRNGDVGVKYFECDGLNILDAYQTVTKVFEYARTVKKPAFLRFKTVRLLGHAGSDIETTYRSLSDIESSESLDPIMKTAQILIDNEILSHEQVLDIYLKLEARIDRVGELVVSKKPITTAAEVMDSIIPRGTGRVAPANPSEEERKKIFGSEWEQMKFKHPLNKLLNWGLTDLLLKYSHALVFGEDVAKKGGVYNVTANLQNRFGMDRVFNSLLDETSILGTAIGLAHNNFLPIPEIQFLAYVHNAEDQIRGEAATLSFFSKGQYTNGMIVRIAGLAYQKGFGGHYHNDNSFALFRDIPGLIVACPSNGVDAVKMLRTCAHEAYVNGRVVIFLEPIALYPVRDLNVQGDGLWCGDYPQDLNDQIEIGEFGIQAGSSELCLVSYGNGNFLSQQAREILKTKYNIDPTIIDLRWMAPLNEAKLALELSKYKNVLVVEECRKTGSLSEGLFTLMMEHCKPLPRVKRVYSADSFIPLADAANLVLVQTEDVVRAALQLVEKK